MPASQIEDIRRAYEGFGRDDIDTLLAVLAPRIEWDASDALAHRGVYRDHEGVREYIEGISSFWDEFELVPDEFNEAAGGAHVIVLGAVRGRLKGNPTSVELRFAHVLEVEDGKVVRLKICLDRDAANEVLAASAPDG